MREVKEWRGRNKVVEDNPRVGVSNTFGKKISRGTYKKTGFVD